MHGPLIARGSSATEIAIGRSRKKQKSVASEGKRGREKLQKRKKVVEGEGKKEKTFVSLRGSALNLRCDGVVHRSVDPLSIGGFMENDALRKLQTRRRR